GNAAPSGRSRSHSQTSSCLPTSRGNPDSRRVLRAPRLDRARYGELRGAAARLDLDLDRFTVDRHVLADHRGDLGAHLLEAAAVEPGAILGEHEVQAALR